LVLLMVDSSHWRRLAGAYRVRQTLDQTTIL
jgi:hypothetical protein